MKIFNPILYFLSFIFFVNCSSVKKEPIVDHKVKTDSDSKYYDFESTQNQQTIVLIDKKEVPLSSFKEFMQQDKIKNFNVIKDTIEIKKLNYSTKKIKAIIIASKK